MQCTDQRLLIVHRGILLWFARGLLLWSNFCYLWFHSFQSFIPLDFWIFKFPSLYIFKFQMQHSNIHIFRFLYFSIFTSLSFKHSNFRIFRFRNPSAFGSLIFNFSNDLSLIFEFETDRECVRIYIFSVLYISMFSNFLIAVSRNFGTELLPFQLLCFANIRSTLR